MLRTTIIPQLGFDLLKEAEQLYTDKQKIPNEALLQLHAVFGNVLSLAAELLESCKITKYETADKCRKVYKIGSNLERYTIYDSIIFCQCQSFQNQVLTDQINLTCKHVLALKLNQITKSVRVVSETVTDSQFVEFLNEQLSCIDE
jgi:predicted nucleic acid-binding Zn finger protein